MIGKTKQPPHGGRKKETMRSIRNYAEEVESIDPARDPSAKNGDDRTYVRWVDISDLYSGGQPTKGWKAKIRARVSDLQAEVRVLSPGYLAFRDRALRMKVHPLRDAARAWRILQSSIRGECPE